MTNFDPVKNYQKLKARIIMSQINCIRGMLYNMHKNTITLPHCLMYLVNIICLMVYYFVYFLEKPHMGNYVTATCYCFRCNKKVVY